ncbi:hypothetical protein GPECTOR_6g867 [Gonium pectorale]|uniref:Uncharacterized protein n=1 Tax=Gonium pectorale TaxID=33097 RepID=A0A150GVT4_GONPE|nr:hypothetical protein GPECTOR_6g867 [Gonium pectorale]|eukprot:KXZ53949.1 hypothetical protein GPECTOR_6g867 [Gonium pectorale]
MRATKAAIPAFAPQLYPRVTVGAAGLAPGLSASEWSEVLRCAADADWLPGRAAAEAALVLMRADLARLGLLPPPPRGTAAVAAAAAGSGPDAWPHVETGAAPARAGCADDDPGGLPRLALQLGRLLAGMARPKPLRAGGGDELLEQLLHAALHSRPGTAVGAEAEEGAEEGARAQLLSWIVEGAEPCGCGSATLGPPRSLHSRPALLRPAAWCELVGALTEELRNGAPAPAPAPGPAPASASASASAPASAPVPAQMRQWQQPEPGSAAGPPSGSAPAPWPGPGLLVAFLEGTRQEIRYAMRRQGEWDRARGAGEVTRGSAARGNASGEGPKHLSYPEPDALELLAACMGALLQLLPCGGIPRPPAAVAAVPEGGGGGEASGGESPLSRWLGWWWEACLHAARRPDTPLEGLLRLLQVLHLLSRRQPHPHPRHRSLPPSARGDPGLRAQEVVPGGGGGGGADRMWPPPQGWLGSMAAAVEARLLGAAPGSRGGGGVYGREGGASEAGALPASASEPEPEPAAEASRSRLALLLAYLRLGLHRHGAAGSPAAGGRRPQLAPAVLLDLYRSGALARTPALQLAALLRAHLQLATPLSWPLPQRPAGHEGSQRTGAQEAGLVDELAAALLSAPPRPQHESRRADGEPSSSRTHATPFQGHAADDPSRVPGLRQEQEQQPRGRQGTGGLGPGLGPGPPPTPAPALLPLPVLADALAGLSSATRPLPRGPAERIAAFTAQRLRALAAPGHGDGGGGGGAADAARGKQQQPLVDAEAERPGAGSGGGGFGGSRPRQLAALPDLFLSLARLAALQGRAGAEGLRERGPACRGNPFEPALAACLPPLGAWLSSCSAAELVEAAEPLYAALRLCPSPQQPQQPDTGAEGNPASAPSPSCPSASASAESAWQLLQGCAEPLLSSAGGGALPARFPAQLALRLSFADRAHLEPRFVAALCAAVATEAELAAKRLLEPYARRRQQHQQHPQRATPQRVPASESPRSGHRPSPPQPRPQPGAQPQMVAPGDAASVPAQVPGRGLTAPEPAEALPAGGLVADDIGFAAASVARLLGGGMGGRGGGGGGGRGGAPPPASAAARQRQRLAEAALAAAPLMGPAALGQALWALGELEVGRGRGRAWSHGGAGGAGRRPSRGLRACL